MKYHTLNDIKVALENDREIRIIGVKEDTSELLDGHTHHRPHQMVTFYITLKQDTYDPKVLTRWLLKYDPKRNLNSNIFNLNVDFLTLTSLFFREVIGEMVVSRELKFTDKNLVSRFDLKDGIKKLQTLHNLERGVAVRLFPNAHFARLAKKNLPCSSDGYWIPVKELRKSDGKFF